MIKHNTNIDYRKTLDVARVHNAALREKPDYTAEAKPASLWAFLGAIIVTLIGGIVFGLNYHGGSFQKFVKNYQPSAPGGIVEKPKEETAYDRGRKVYATNCASCHQASGSGVAGQYPPLAGSEWVTGSDERLGLILLYGMSGPVTVKGQKYSGANQMPPWASIGEQKIADVLTFIRSEWGNKASEVTAAGLKDLKSRHPGRTAPSTEEELLKIPDDKMLPGAAAK
jgi:mono/diheme cytochrome c family protein